jgi:hypothetical protein
MKKEKGRKGKWKLKAELDTTSIIRGKSIVCWSVVVPIRYSLEQGLLFIV